MSLVRIKPLISELWGFKHDHLKPQIFKMGPMITETQIYKKECMYIQYSKSRVLSFHFLQRTSNGYSRFPDPTHPVVRFRDIDDYHDLHPAEIVVFLVKWVCLKMVLPTSQLYPIVAILVGKMSSNWFAVIH